MQKEGDEVSADDSAIDRCFININKSDNSSDRHCGKSVMTLHQRDCQEGAQPEPSAVKGDTGAGEQFYQLSFNNSTHFLTTNLASDVVSPKNSVSTPTNYQK